MTRVPLLVFSHLRWDFVFQRPQHVMSRLADSREVVFIEEPHVREGEPRLSIRSVESRLRIVQPQLDVGGPGFGPAQQEPLERLLREWIEGQGWPGFAAWLYTPMAIRIARALEPRAIFYDCMDELSAFLGAPPELLERERELLTVADAVFTGGPSLYRAKKDRHPRVHCFPSSVDLVHFAGATRSAEPADQARLPRPRIGYYGVIDERIDLAILDRLASELPETAIVMVGPVVKIDPASLPKRPNLHYLGQKDYRELPAYVGGWDVAMMPFALNEATRFISPTKVLEYMAAGRAIVSTSIRDVAEPYGDIVHLGDGPDGFVAACRRALELPNRDRDAREERARRVLESTSWDETVRRMEAIVHEFADGSSDEPTDSATAGARGARS